MTSAISCQILPSRILSDPCELMREPCNCRKNYTKGNIYVANAQKQRPYWIRILWQIWNAEKPCPSHPWNITSIKMELTNSRKFQIQMYEMSRIIDNSFTTLLDVLDSGVAEWVVQWWHDTVGVVKEYNEALVWGLRYRLGPCVRPGALGRGGASAPTSATPVLRARRDARSDQQVLCPTQLVQIMPRPRHTNMCHPETRSLLWPCATSQTAVVVQTGSAWKFV